MMSPHIAQTEMDIIVRFAESGEKTVMHPLKVVLDYDDKRKVMGIEVINLAHLLEMKGPPKMDIVEASIKEGDGSVRASYDDECDCLYLRLRPGASVDQKSVEGYVLRNTEGQLVAFGATL